jgi:hypothetical protein
MCWEFGVVGKFVGAIIGAITTAVGILTANPALIASGLGMIATSAVALLFAPSMPKTDAATTQKKEPTPVRSKGYGTRRVFAKMMLFETALNGATVDVLAFLDGRSHARGQVYLNDDKVTLVGDVVQPLDDGRYGDLTPPKVYAGFNLGLATETAFAAVISLLPGIWTADHRGDGITSGYLIKNPVKDKNFLTVYPQGDSVVMSAVFDMQYLFDPRDETMDAYDPDSWVVSNPLLDNPALALLHYLITDRGVDYDTQILPVIDMWTDAADHCDEMVEMKDGSFEKRYRCWFLYDMTAEPAQVITEIIKTFDGWYCQDALGRYLVYSGKFYEPTVTIGPEHIVDARHQAYVEEEDFYNEIVVTYISTPHDFNEVDTDPWRDEDDISERGKENSTSFNPQVPSHAQARRLTKRQMARNNAPDRGTITTNYAGQIVEGQRYIHLNHVEAGATFYSGPAEVVTSPEKNLQTGGVTFDWVAVSESIDTWNAATEEGEPAALGDRVAPEPLDAPVIASATAELASDGSSAQIRIIGDAPDRNDLTWYVGWKAASDSIWNEAEYTDIDPSPSVELLTSLVPTNSSIDVRIAYQTGDGRLSPWSSTETESTSTTSLATGPTTDVSASGGVGSITVNWRNPASLNYGYTRSYYGATNVFGAATALTPDDVAGTLAYRSVNFTGITAGAYYVWTRAFSSTGVGSSPTIASGTVTVT